MGDARGSSSLSKKEHIEDLLGRLNLQEEEEESFVWEEEIVELPEVAKWLAIMQVHTTRGFSPTALYSDIRSAWNPAKEVIWRNIDDNLFTIQFRCLADWNNAMNMGPWLFQKEAVVMEEYDGFENPRSIVLDKLAVWARVLRLLDSYLHEVVISGMCRPMGEITDVQINLPAGYVGEFVRVRVKINVMKKLVRFVSIIKDTKKV